MLSCGLLLSTSELCQRPRGHVWHRANAADPRAAGAAPIETKAQGAALAGPEIIARKKHPALTKLRLAWTVRRAAGSGSYGEKAYARFLAGLDGAMPEADEPFPGTILAACNDLYYWRFAVTLVLSIERLGAPEAVHLHLCAPGAETLAHVRRLAAGLAHVRLTWTADPCALAEGLPYVSVYFAAVRFLIGNAVLERTGRPVLCIDVDGIAVKPVWPAYAPVQAGGDAVLIRRPEHRSAVMRILASAAGLNPTADGRRFASALARALSASFALRPAYHVDQIVIHYLSEAMAKRGRLRVADMPRGLADHDFGEASAIWTAKGWKTKNSRLYLDRKQAVDEAFPQLAVPSEP